ncbi:hypothetical protein ABPG75_007026 [Micractinium tetrahymenae]
MHWRWRAAQAALLLLALVAGAGAQQCGAPGRRRRGGADDLPLPDLPTALAAANDAVARAAPDNELVDAGETLVQSYQNSSDVLDPGAAAQALEALSLVAAATEGAPYRGAVLLGRGTLLEVLVRPEASQSVLELGARLLQQQALPAVERAGGAGGAAYEAAKAAVKAQDGYTTSMQRWVIGRLLRVARALQNLGQESRSEEILGPLPAAAVALGDAGSYIGAMGQRSKMTDEELEELMACTARLDKQQAPRSATPGSSGTADGAEGTEGAAEAAAPRQPVTVGTPGGPCPWLFNVTQERGAPLYYSLHRALHSRKRHDEAWAALATAKVLSGPCPEWEAEDYQAMLEDLAVIFPPAEAAAAGAGVEVVDEDEDGMEEAEKAQQQGPEANGTAAAAGGPAGADAAAGGLAQRLSHAGKQAAAALAQAAAAARAWLAGAARAAGVGGHGAGQAASSSAVPAISMFAHLGEIRPIFVTGLPRSGSTLIEQILSSHPDVWGAGEHTKLNPVVTELLDDIAEKGTVTGARLEELRKKYEDGMRSLMPPEALNATWLVDKNLGNAWHIGYIALMMPRACILHAVRHPADTSLSSFQQSFHPQSIPWSFNLTHMADHVQAHHRIMAHWRRALPGRVLDVHYSQMVDDMEGTTRKILEHCSLSWHPNMLRFYETKRFVYTASLLQVRRPIYSTSVGKWQAYKKGLAPLLVTLRDTILKYEEMSGLPSSEALIDELAAELAIAQEQGQAEAKKEAEANEQATAEAEQKPAAPERAQQAGATADAAAEQGQAAQALQQGACSAGQGSAGSCGVDAAATS